MKNQRIKINKNDYSLRQAAGKYWLLDMTQKGIPYKRPMTLNEVGAKIWKLMEQELTEGEIAGELAMEYEIDEKQLQDDVEQFINQLKAYGVRIEE